MTTAFQYVFDNAETINWNRRPNVAQTTTRGNVVRSLSRGGQAWRFEVKLPDGIPWSQARPFIETIEALGRSNPGTVQINNDGYNAWLTGSLSGVTLTTGSWTQGSNEITTADVLAVGDIIQLGAGKVYSMVSPTTVHRPVIDATGSGTITVGPQVTWQVICTEMPQWTIFARDQVSWSGAFIFSEVL